MTNLFNVAVVFIVYSIWNAVGFPGVGFKCKLQSATLLRVGFERSKKARASHTMVLTDAATKPNVLSPKGLFTNSSPESKRVVPSGLDGKTKFKIVYVVLESQYQSVLIQACQSINAGTEPVGIEAVGYLLEELRNPAAFEKFKEDVGSANIFIGSLIFVQELADKVGFASN